MLSVAGPEAILVFGQEQNNIRPISNLAEMGMPRTAD